MMRQESAKRAKRDELLFSLMFIDLDGFKQVNDTLGHDKGDMLLAEAARRISKCVREADTVARLGGDEFTIFLPEVASRADIERIAQGILRELGNSFQLEEKTAFVSASIGVVFYLRATQRVQLVWSSERIRRCTGLRIMAEAVMFTQQALHDFIRVYRALVASSGIY